MQDSKVLEKPNSNNNVVILHGLFGSKENLQTLAKLLYESLDANIHLLDLPNHGQAIRSDDCSFDFMGATIAQYISNNDLENVTLIGHSLGGKVAINCAFNHSASVNNLSVQYLIVLDIAPKQYSAAPYANIFTALCELDLAKINSRTQVETILKVSINNKMIIAFLIRSLYKDAANKFNWRFNLEALSKTDAIYSSPLKENDEVTTKTLFIRGGKSDYILDSDSLSIAKHFNDYAIKTIPQAEHWLHFSHPTETLNIILDFIK